MKKYQGPLKGYYLFAQISGILLCSVFGCLGLGIWLDNKLGTAPWLLLVLMIMGLAFAMYTIYRTVNEAS
ncbi:MAG: AtpZ/AtpI family protein [Anaerolineae bacterium]|nr:AtpZ/AtpI family protein [Anaerolineae bacterium]